MSEVAKTNPDCPCPATDCENRCHCEPCREKHYAKGGKPFCEREEAEQKAEPSGFG